MSFYALNDSPLLHKARSTPFTPPRGKQIWFVILTFLVAISLESIVTTVYSFIAIFPHFEELADLLLADNLEGYTDRVMQILVEMNTSTGYLLLSLFSTVFIIGASIFVVLKLEHRSLSSMGLPKAAACPYALLGAVGGVLLFAAVIGVSLLNGSIALESGNTTPLYFILFLLGFIVQGSSEEILLRGFVMTSLLRAQKPLSAALVTSLFFSLLHIGNPGINFLAVVNIFLFGMAMAVLTLRTGSLIPAMGIHALWNFAEGCIFGASVSGLPKMPSLFYTVLDEGKSLTNGGDFGPEGGIAATLVLLLFLILVLFLPAKNKTENTAA